MTPSELLAELTPGAARRDEAMLELRQLLDRVAWKHAQMREARKSSDEAERHLVELALARAFDNILRKSPLPCIPNGDAACWGYCRSVAVNAWRDLLRRLRRKREVEKEAPSTSEAAPERHIGPPPAALAARLETVFDEHLRAVEDRYHDDQRRGWAQMKALCWGQRTMDEVMATDEGIGPASSEDDVRRARNRLATNHKRLRRALSETTRLLGVHGRLVPDEATSVAEYLLRMVRCGGGGR